MRGLGFQMDLQTGRTRQWYAGEDGVQRWADNDAPVNAMPESPIFDRLAEDMADQFGTHTNTPGPGPEEIRK